MSSAISFGVIAGGGYVRDVPDGDPKESTEIHLLQNEEVYAITGDPMHKRGVLYILDEWHVYFPARQVMQKHSLNWVFQYGTQHGHFSDTIFLITQSLSYIDKIFREWTQDYIYLENERLRKVRGFRKGNGMVARFYQFPPTLGTEEPDDSEYLPLDTQGYARLYDTSGGAGIAGGGSADKGAKVKGLPLKSIWLLGGGAFALLVMLLFIGKSALDSWLFSPRKPDVIPSPAVSESASPVALSVPLARGSSALSASANSSQDDPPAVVQSVTWDRMLQRGARVFVYLSDGRVISAPSRFDYDPAGLVDFVDLDGRHWRLSRSSSKWSQSVAQQQDKDKK